MLNGRYQLTQRIAAGGMGEVWRGEDLLLHREIAVKVLLPALMADADFITRFRAEARMMAALRHPGVVQVYDYGENAQVGNARLDFMVMEFIEGTPLSKKIQDAGRLAPAETMTVVAQVAEALQAAHEAGIVHRDVKPSNLLVRPAGAIVLVDFGVARSAGITSMTGTNVVLGSAHYMAPEQAEGHPVTARTDIYALGAVAFSCLTGRPPYVGDNPLAVLAQLVHGKPPVLPPDVPPPVASVVLRALARDPGQRFPSAAAFGAAARGAASPSSYGTGTVPRQPQQGYSPGAPAGSGAFGPGSGSAAFLTAGGSATGRNAPFGGPRNGPGTGSHPVTPGSATGGPQGFAPRPPAGGPHGFATGSAAAGVPGSARGNSPQGFATGSVPRSASHGGPRGFAPGSAAVGAAGSATGGFASGQAGGPHGFTPGQAGGGARGFGDDVSSNSGSYGSPSGSLTAPTDTKRRNLNVALAATAVVAVLAGIGIILGNQSGDDPGTGNAIGAGDKQEATAAAPDKQTTTRPGGKKPTARPDEDEPTRPAGEAPAAGEPTTKPTDETAPDPTGDPEPDETGPATNPEDPAALCGSGYSILDSKELVTKAGAKRGTVYLLSQADGGMNCVVTLKNDTLDQKTSMSATLEVKGDKTYSESGSFQYYAGPVRAAAPGTCVKWGGTIGGMSFTSDFSHCN